MPLTFDNHPFLVYAPTDFDQAAFATELDQYQVPDAQVGAMIVCRSISDINAAILANPTPLPWCAFLARNTENDVERKLLFTYWGAQSTFADALNAQEIDIAMDPRTMDLI